MTMKLLKSLFILSISFSSFSQGIEKLNGDALFGNIEARQIGPSSYEWSC